MANTTNFGWETPDDTDLVKDGAAAMRTLGNSIDASFVDLKGGTTGQVLSKNSNTDLDFTWVAQDDSNAIQNAIVDAKGDLISATAADTPARLAVGTTGQVLTVDSTTATGLKWATPSSGTTTWTQVRNPDSSALNRIVLANGVYIAVGQGGTLVTSTNGTTWTTRTSGFGGSEITGAAYGAGVYVIVGGSGLISTSTDLATWTARTSNFGAYKIDGVKFLNNQFIAYGANFGTGRKGIVYSTDGITWTAATGLDATNGTNEFIDVDYGNGYYLAVGDVGNTTNAAYSTNGTSWTTLQIGSASAHTWTFCHYDGTNWIVAGVSTGARYRATNPTGTFSVIGEAFQTNGNGYIGATTAVFNGKIYMLSTTTGGEFIFNVSTEISGGTHQTLGTPILLPTYNSSSGSTQADYPFYYALCVESATKILIGDGKGRIFISF